MIDTRPFSPVALALAALAVGSACSQAPDSESPATEDPASSEVAVTSALDTPFACGAAGADPNFYSWTQALPAQNGTVLKCEALTADGDAGAPANGTLKGYRVVYKTTALTHTGNTTVEVPVPASGTVWIPAGPIVAKAAADAGTTPAPPLTRPVIADTHGAVGVLPVCGPSRTGSYDSGYVSKIIPSLRTDPVVVAPDYVGLGIDHGMRVAEAGYLVSWPDGTRSAPFSNITHPFVSLEGEGRATIDLVRAARQLPNAHLTGEPVKWITFGQSQGGHAAIGTAEVVYRHYADEMNLLGVVAGAPASELDKNAWWTPDLRNALFGMITASIPLEWRGLRASSFLTVDGLRAISNTTNKVCFVEDTLLQTLAQYNVVDLFSTDPFSIPAVLTALGTYSPGRAPLAVPVFVGQVRGDPLIDSKRTGYFVAHAVSTSEITFCEYYGGTVTNAAEQNIYGTLNWTLRANDHNAFAKMFGGSQYRIQCTRNGVGVAASAPVTPPDFVKQLAW
jgi:Secretory lipase